MTDRDALLAAILAAPDDDLARLVYADCLEENGDRDRAAFIRHQVEAAQADPASPAGRVLAAKAAQLLKPNKAAWSAHARGAAIESTFARGFIDWVSTNVATFPTAAPALFARDPVRGVKLIRFNNPGARASLVPVFESPHAARLARVELPSVHPTADELTALSTGPHTQNLRELVLSHNPLPPDWVATLIRFHRLPHLAELDVTHCAHLGPTLAAALPAAGHRAFTALDLTGVTLSPQHLAAVLASSCLAGLETFRMAVPSQNDEDDDADGGWGVHLARALADTGWPRVRVLDLSGQRIGGDGAGYLAYAPFAKSMRRLILPRNRISTLGVQHLLNAPDLDLYELDLRGNPLGLSDRGALQRRFPSAVIRG